jgi:DNA polymerase-3 subunit gamma/tau
MLSTHSFNALLKTLEEPPPHVKFLLATTDPQKLPVTILSRCLQFNLKNLSSERIVEHLKLVLTEEATPFDDSALWALARSADGSMRDALSLTDQAIGHGNGSVLAEHVNVMLGTIERSHVIDICQALAAADGSALMTRIALMAEQAPDYQAALGDFIALASGCDFANGTRCARFWG